MRKCRHHHLLYYIEKAIEYDTSKCYSRKSLKMLLSVKEQSSKVCKEFDIESFISHWTFYFFIFYRTAVGKGVFFYIKFFKNDPIKTIGKGFPFPLQSLSTKNE